MIAIIDYKAGNLTSVKRALDSLGQDSIITSSFTEVHNADRIIFPGVGAAGRAISDLKKQNLDNAIREAYKMGKPILGICLGTQIIMERSEENGTECLGLIKGDVRRFQEGLRGKENRILKIPHMGWNSVSLLKKHMLFQGVPSQSEFYFVHSYYPAPSDPKMILGETEYGICFASVLAWDSLVAMQFHPEKSGRPGLRILSNFCKWSGKEDVE